jgi:glycerophosphoryl diester phosphodiesterase
MQNYRSFFIFAFIFAALITGIRIFIFTYNGDLESDDYFLAILIGFVNEFMIGTIVAYGYYFFARNILFRILLDLLIVLFVSVSLACFHYESVFGHLPGIDLLFYITEINALSSSLHANIPLSTYIAELSVVSCAIILSGNMLGFSASGQQNYATWGIATFILVIGSLLLQIFPGLVPNKYINGSRQAVVWLIQSNFIRKTYDLEELKIGEQDITQFLNIHGIKDPGPMLDTDYPICRIQTVNRRTTKKDRSIIFLILESVGYQEMLSSFNGRVLMPNLRSIADENILFRNVYAPGMKSAQGLVAMYSGLPAQPFVNYLWFNPLITFQGFPSMLRDKGYRTMYLHGGDLAFERQRQYLEEAGFDDLFEFDPDLPYQSYGWGYDDGTMFHLLQEKITQQTRSDKHQPFLATLFTLSTHDPYILPRDWHPVFSEKTRIMVNKSYCCTIEGELDNRKALAEAYHYLDYQLGRFYEWYRHNLKDTLLIITGDHTPPLDIFNTEVPDQYRFKIPLVIAGLDEQELMAYHRYSDRTAGLHDLPNTLMFLLDEAPNECSLGVNLFSPEAEWPRDRYVYSVAGDTNEYMLFWQNGSKITYDRIRNIFTIDGITLNSGEQIKKFNETVNNLFKVHYVLLNKNAYSFNNTMGENRKKTGMVVTPLFISHRGNTAGLSSHLHENRKQGIEKAIAAGFEWIEIDVQFTSDMVPVLMHDPAIEVNGEIVPLPTLTHEELISLPGYRDVLTLEKAVKDYASRVNFLIEIKSGDSVQKEINISRIVSRIIKSRDSDKKIIIDSFSEYLVQTIQRYCDCEAGFDTPFKKKISYDDLRYYRKMNYDWLYVHYSVIDEQLIQDAHALGLKIMAYTVNDHEILDKWMATGLPDGIITDKTAIKNRISGETQSGQL